MKTKSLLIASALLLTTNCLLPILISAQVKVLYGMTEEGGTNGSGVLFDFNPTDSTYSKKFDFGTASGSNPYGSLIQAFDGNLYGMTYKGGANNFGALFQYNPATSVYTSKLDFDSITRGANPRGSLFQATDSNLYGMTEVGGANGGGVLFRFNPASSAYTDEYDFGAIGVCGPIGGQYPYGSLIQASDGNLYGMTSAGGSYSYGVLFQFNPSTSTYAKKVDFTFTANGAFPFGSLVQASDGNLYGMTYQGGTAGYGALFQYNPVTNAFAKKIDFGAIGGTGTTNGIYPNGSLVQATDGNLYGMTNQGGTNNLGVLFQFNPSTSTYSGKLAFADTTGANPYSSLISASNGILYGMTKAGGTNGKGVLFQFNPVTSAYKKMFDFTGINGQFPWFSNLLEIAEPAGINELYAHYDITLFPNPANTLLYIHSSSLHNETTTISVMNVLGEIMQEEKIKWNRDININLDKLSSGIYFLQLKTESGEAEQKFIKE